MLDVFRRDSWYGWLYRRAYGEDRGWIVLLRRLFGRTGFEYPDPPKVPEITYHACDGESCAVCAGNDALRKAHAAELAAYWERRQQAYALTLQAIRIPPYRQPFFADAPRANVCPTFWAIVFACLVYVPFVLLPKVVLAAGLFAAVGAAGAVAAGFQIVTQHYGRRIATVTAGVVIWSAASALSLAVQEGIAAYRVWQPRHAAAIVAAENLRQAELAAAPEFAAHAVERAMEAWRFETAAILADVAALSRVITENLAYARDRVEQARETLAFLDANSAPSAHLREELAWGPDVSWARVWSNSASLRWGGEMSLYYSATRSHSVFDAVVSSWEDMAAMRDCIAEEAEYLLEADFRAVREFHVAQGALLDAAQQQYERAFVLAAIREGDARRSDPQGLASWMDDLCGQTSDGRWVSSVTGRSPSWHGIRVSTERGDSVYDFPDAACAAVATRFARALTVGRRQLSVSAMRAERESLEAFRRQQDAFIAKFHRLRADPVVLLLTMEEECGAQPYSDYQDRCDAAAEAFSSEIAAAKRALWWNANGQRLFSIAGGVCGVLLAIVLVVIGYSRGSFRLLGRLFAAFWNAPIIAAFRHGCEWVIERASVALGFVLAAVATGTWFVIAIPFVLIYRIAAVIAVATRDTAILIAAFAKAWYEKRCYQITWQ